MDAVTVPKVAFRYTVGMIALVGGLAGVIGLYLAEVPEGNREPLLLALGMVLGWGQTIINAEWGSSPAGRRAAEVGVEAGRKAGDNPTGKQDDPLAVQGPQPGHKPVSVEDEPKGKK